MDMLFLLSVLNNSQLYIFNSLSFYNILKNILQIIQTIVSKTDFFPDIVPIIEKHEQVKYIITTFE